MGQANGVYVDRNMLTYKQAIEKVLEHSFPLKSRRLRFWESLGLVASRDLISHEPFPSFDNSAVDGYAISSLSDKKGQMALEVQGEIRAGECFRGILRPGCAVRIFTGAQVPRGAQAVVMQEDTERVNGHVFLLKRPSAKENVRFAGEDVQKGEVIVWRSTLLNASHLAVLAAVGYEKVPVFPPPKIAILATGSELLKAGKKLKPGKVRDCNSILLQALVEKDGGIPNLLPTVGDNLAKIRVLVRKGLRNDILLIAGGVSVGKYDFVREVLKKEGVREIFWKVDIKPGKPIFFGIKNQTLVFGLPGNPVSVFVTFQEFVRPAIFKMMGKNDHTGGEQVEGYLTKPFQNGSRLHFVRVHCVRGRKGYLVTPLKGQGSHMIGSLAASNGILKVEPNRLLRKNERLSVKII